VKIDDDKWKAPKFKSFGRAGYWREEEMTKKLEDE
jgi:hypothetical protein